jgi:hypothetical protein
MRLMGRSYENQEFLSDIYGSKRIARTWKTMKEVIVQDLKQPMKMLKSADSGGPRRLSV